MSTLEMSVPTHVQAQARLSYPVMELHVVILMRFHFTNSRAKLQQQQQQEGTHVKDCFLDAYFSRFRRL